jgi:hypothetical protein
MKAYLSRFTKKSPVENNFSYTNSPLINGLNNKFQAIEIINKHLEKTQKGHTGEFYHLKD